jgi:pimeloyl-ACP methyl ester carboxylesterase
MLNVAKTCCVSHNGNMWYLLALLALTGTSSVYFLQDKLIFFPEKLEKDHQFKFPIKFKEMWWQVAKEIKVHGLHFFAQQSKGKVILYFHGNAGSLDGWGQVGVELTQLGMDVMVVDYRGYGKSEGAVGPKTILADALYIYDEVAKEYGEENIIVYGRSIGTPMATHIASQRNCYKVILETPFDKMESLVKVHFPIVPTFILKYRFNNIEKIHKINAPILIIHGTRDEVIPYENGKHVASVLQAKDQFVTIDGGMHNNLSNFEAYWQAVKEFLP